MVITNSLNASSLKQTAVIFNHVRISSQFSPNMASAHMTLTDTIPKNFLNSTSSEFKICAVCQGMI